MGRHFPTTLCIQIMDRLGKNEMVSKFWTPKFSILGKTECNEHRRAERWTALNYTSHYPFSRSRARSQQLAQIHVTKFPNQVCWECAGPDHGCPRTLARHSGVRISFSLHCFPRRRARQRCAPPKSSFSLVLREWTSSNSSKSK
jgi:hypothetical protein